MTKKDALKPCPFCEGPASMQCHGGIFHGHSGFRVECEGTCHAMTCYWHSEIEARKLWNMRPTTVCGEWQPIESAPRDGTHFNAYDSMGKVQEVWFSYDCGDFTHGRHDYNYMDIACSEYTTLVGWQPLPSAPER